MKYFSNLKEKYIRALVEQTEETEDIKKPDKNSSNTDDVKNDDENSNNADEEKKLEDTQNNEDDMEKQSSIDTTVEDKIRLKDNIDVELDAVLADFETEALKSAAINKQKLQRESYNRKYNKYCISRYLLENEINNNKNNKPDFDIDRFSFDIARLMKNYQKILLKIYQRN